VAVASAGPYANLAILTPDRLPCQHPTTEFYTGRCPSCRPISSVKALKAHNYLHPKQHTVYQHFSLKYEVFIGINLSF